MSYMLLYIIIIIETYSKNEIKKFKKKKHTQIVLFIYIYIHTYIYIYTINYIRIHTQQHLFVFCLLTFTLKKIELSFSLFFFLE